MKQNTINDAIVALEQLVVRFPLEGYAETPKKCRCLQYEDHLDCRHLHAVRALKAAKKEQKVKR